VPFKIDITTFSDYNLRKYELSCYNIDAEIASKSEIDKLKYANETFFRKVIRLLLGHPRYRGEFYFHESSLRFDPRVYDKTVGYFDGYWQTERYFADFKEEIRKQFKISRPLHSATLRLLTDILEKNSVGIHVRRGDYVHNRHTNAMHGTCPLQYYQKAVSFILEQQDNCHLFVFTDDIPWVKRNMRLSDRQVIVELPEEVPDYEAMYLMSQCRHNIIANSSFSWWGAWLNKNPRKIVVAPRRWFRSNDMDAKDIIPNEWIRL